ncbi:uncharacterized protein ARMOST_02542 [Armillaria ostoyae]|uniref:Uncharacterized protein n=1 Tax=Armillaria ostoyae TaxID=47428 RepID=A0A284QS89_ARMOS|nr:uncharacterized protein ARMOST_02542 [Armillaria ostoyae]
MLTELGNSGYDSAIEFMVHICYSSTTPILYLSLVTTSRNANVDTLGKSH